MPAEWTPHDAVWTAWPHAASEWADGLEGPKRSLAAMIAAIVDVEAGSGRARGERVELMVRDAGDEAEVRAMLGPAATGVRFRHGRFGDVWLRDTGPIFVMQEHDVAAARFLFDGWAGKYVMPGDTEVSAQVMAWTGVKGAVFEFVLEGGALDVDGDGTTLTTRSCLLDGVRNPSLDAQALERRLRWALGIEHVVWLASGLINDHTDGHVDTLARFVAPGVVACMEPARGDPNGDALDSIIRDLQQARTARGERIEVVTVPSPGAVLDAAGKLLPASYMNFYIANTTVVVPTYGVANDDRAVDAIQRMFPGRRAIGVPGKAVVVGGGAFHCCTQQQPAAARGATP
jgi:agmatine deiminase